MKRMLAAALILTLAVLALPAIFKLDKAAARGYRERGRTSPRHDNADICTSPDGCQA